jgi:hypothetical protein
MKRLGAVFIFALLSVYGFAQSQTGNASYNASKNGFTISHPSMSFNTRVRITNLRNNREVIATVDSRTLPDPTCIADISRQAGDAIGMSSSGHTEVRIEQFHETQAAAPVPPPPAVTPPPADPPRQAPPPAPAPVPQPEPREEIIQVITPSQVQYVPAPVVEQVQCPLSPAVIVLLAIIASLLTAILVLLIQARRSIWWPGHPWWFGRYPLWMQRRIRYLKERRR